MKGDEPAIVGSRPAPDGTDVTAGSHVAILLGTCNGARHLGEQLQSLRAQTHVNWSLWVSDDGSTDATLEMVRAFGAQGSQPVHVLQGPQQGFGANYMSLVARADPAAQAYAFCDQDDIWLPHHLQLGVAALAAHPADQPALYCGRTLYMNAQGQPCGTSRPAPRVCNFARALAQNVCAGNTMLLNRPALALLREAAPQGVSAHDWLAYLFVTAVEGPVVFDPVATVKYRQHPGNAMGENRSLRAKWQRVWRLAAGDLRTWTDANLAALAQIEPRMTTHNQGVLRLFRSARTGPAWTRLGRLRQSGVRRASAAAQLAYVLALLLNRV